MSVLLLKILFDAYSSLGSSLCSPIGLGSRAVFLSFQNTTIKLKITQLKAIIFHQLIVQG